MKLYKVYVNSSFSQGSRYVVLFNVFEGDYNEKGPKKVVQIAYELSSETGLRCTIEIPKDPGVLKGGLAPTEFTAIATLFIGGIEDIRKALKYNTDEDSWKKFQSMNARSVAKAYLVTELMDTFGSYTAVNHAVMHNIPTVLLSLM